jgi:hypothetical protein
VIGVAVSLILIVGVVVVATLRLAPTCWNWIVLSTESPGSWTSKVALAPALRKIPWGPWRSTACPTRAACPAPAIEATYAFARPASGAVDWAPAPGSMAYTPCSNSTMWTPFEIE